MFSPWRDLASRHPNLRLDSKGIMDITEQKEKQTINFHALIFTSFCFSFVFTSFFCLSRSFVRKNGGKSDQLTFFTFLNFWPITEYMYSSRSLSDILFFSNPIQLIRFFLGPPPSVRLIWSSVCLFFFSSFTFSSSCFSSSSPSSFFFFEKKGNSNVKMAKFCSL